MVPALIVIVAIAVGLPLLAWWIGGRGFWGRLRPSPVRLVPSEIRARYRLTVLELNEVQRAAGEGRAQSDPRLRAATADYARDALDRLQKRRRLPERLMAVGVALVVVGIVVRFVFGDWPSGSLFVSILVCANPIVQGFNLRRLRIRLQRAIELNTEQDAASRQNGSGGHLQPGRPDS